MNTPTEISTTANSACSHLTSSMRRMERKIWTRQHWWVVIFPFVCWFRPMEFSAVSVCSKWILTPTRSRVSRDVYRSGVCQPLSSWCKRWTSALGRAWSHHHKMAGWWHKSSTCIPIVKDTHTHTYTHFLSHCSQTRWESTPGMMNVSPFITSWRS